MTCYRLTNMYDILQITVVAVDYKMSLKNNTGKEPEYRDIISQVGVLVSFFWVSASVYGQIILAL